MERILRAIFFKIWYWYISSVDKNAEVIFMNYGYAKDGEDIKLDEKDEANRYSAQLYHLVATGADLKGKDILEVGSGRGGGLSYVNRYLLPKSATGLDLNNKAVEFSNKHYTAQKNLTFLQGNAEELDFEDASFDAILNVESSHRYLNIDKFMAGVKRILKPDGYFLFTDFRKKGELEKLDEELQKAGFKTISKRIITPNVVKALDLASAAREKLVYKLTPRFLHSLAKNFAATKGSPTYKQFCNNELIYAVYVLQK